MLHEEAAARSLQKGAFFWQTDCAKAAEEVQELPVFEKAVTALSMTLAATGGAGQVRSLCEKFTQSVCVCARGTFQTAALTSAWPQSMRART